MRSFALGLVFIMPLAGCTSFPWDYDAQNSRIAACYYGATPDDVTSCLGRENLVDPAYPVAFKPGGGAFCSPDLDKKECRAFLESADEPSLPAS